MTLWPKGRSQKWSFNIRASEIGNKVWNAKHSQQCALLEQLLTRICKKNNEFKTLMWVAYVHSDVGCPHRLQKEQWVQKQWTSDQWQCDHDNDKWSMTMWSWQWQCDHDNDNVIMTMTMWSWQWQCDHDNDNVINDKTSDQWQWSMTSDQKQWTSSKTMNKFKNNEQWVHRLQKEQWVQKSMWVAYVNSDVGCKVIRLGAKALPVFHKLQHN